MLQNMSCFYKCYIADSSSLSLSIFFLSDCSSFPLDVRLLLFFNLLLGWPS
uniref:Uncharacterized protein n=1 Tax=Arundo donax TaxID=35708 RepID=A0A0A9GEN0_ARUDO